MSEIKIDVDWQPMVDEIHRELLGESPESIDFPFPIDIKPQLPPETTGKTEQDNSKS